ncbi:pantoate--beta-alanine ligase [Actinospongicola halichondriae]|uniref:pantoate--beta-alanine ligase n=1 Tax=Actinospongicola halichondriae TaxID=3236844 RepID=UPI003D4E8940
MKRVHTIDDLRSLLDEHRSTGGSVGFVPTMGYLHDGHVSLMRTARAECGLVVSSVFVNPLQFAAGEDLDDYPRDLEGDAVQAESAGVDVLFVPSVSEMYPDGHPIATTVSVSGVSEGFEGASRPTHFAGVATVVAKLFSIVGPCAAYFGEKDFQQLAVVRRMVADLSMPVTVIGCETVREADGLAMSSRNAYLDDAQRAAAPVVNQALRTAAAAIVAGETDPAAVRDLMAAVVAEQTGPETVSELDYCAVVDAATLTVPETLHGDLRLLIAVRFAHTRLIDNVGVTAAAAPTQGS